MKYLLLALTMMCSNLALAKVWHCAVLNGHVEKPTFEIDTEDERLIARVLLDDEYTLTCREDISFMRNVCSFHAATETGPTPTAIFRSFVSWDAGVFSLDATLGETTYNLLCGSV